MKGWVRVTRKDPCRVCKKDDWCTWHEKIGACCMRVQSSKPMRNGGWLHPHDGEVKYRPLPPKAPPQPVIDAEEIMEGWRATTAERHLQEFARDLGVSYDSLLLLGAAWSHRHQAWAFPMSDGFGKCIGIRLRDHTGKKWAVPGSRNGIFMPRTRADREVLVTEGPTDTAAALTMGFYALGRPSCSGALDMIKQACRTLSIQRLIIVSDNDGPGYAGAQRLANEVPIPACVISTPAKDIRQFVQLGGNRLTLNCILQNTVWRNTPKA